LLIYLGIGFDVLFTIKWAECLLILESNFRFDLYSGLEKKKLNHPVYFCHLIKPTDDEWDKFASLLWKSVTLRRS
jgi:hypothetical protein